MTALISLLIIVFIGWLLMNNARKNTPRDQITLKNTIDPKPPRQVYQGSPDDFTGEGSDLIRKFSGKHADDDLDELLAEIVPHDRPKKRSVKLVKTSVSGTITFDYIDSKYERSSRVLRVKEVDALHISGYCQTARAFRTFMLDGIASDVTDTETGEVMPADLWIDQAKKAARSGSLKK